MRRSLLTVVLLGTLALSQWSCRNSSLAGDVLSSGADKTITVSDGSLNLYFSPSLTFPKTWDQDGPNKAWHHKYGKSLESVLVRYKDQLDQDCSAVPAACIDVDKPTKVQISYYDVLQQQKNISLFVHTNGKVRLELEGNYLPLSDQFIQIVGGKIASVTIASSGRTINDCAAHQGCTVSFLFK